MRLEFDHTFIFGNVLEEDIYEDILISLIPFVSMVSLIERVDYLTRAGAGVAVVARGLTGFSFSGASTFSGGCFSEIFPSSGSLLSLEPD